MTVNLYGYVNRATWGCYIMSADPRVWLDFIEDDASSKAFLANHHAGQDDEGDWTKPSSMEDCL